MSSNTLRVWTKEDMEIIEANRFLSTKDLVALLGRPTGSVKQMRSKLKSPRLAVCKNCGMHHKYINQHEVCADCAPSQKEYSKGYNKSLNGRWQMYKSNAKKRGIAFNLSILDFQQFWQQPCTYCGDEIEIVGVDRVNSSLPYDLGNTVSCCFRCNEMKMDSTTEDWFNKMKQILKFQGEML